MKLWVVQYSGGYEPDYVHIFEREEDAERLADLYRKKGDHDVDVWPVTPKDSARATAFYNERNSCLTYP